MRICVPYGDSPNLPVRGYKINSFAKARDEWAPFLRWELEFMVSKSKSKESIHKNAYYYHH